MLIEMTIVEIYWEDFKVVREKDDGKKKYWGRAWFSEELFRKPATSVVARLLSLTQSGKYGSISYKQLPIL